MMTSGIARFEIGEGQFFIKGAQSQEGVLKRRAEYPKRSTTTICLERVQTCLKGALYA